MGNILDKTFDFYWEDTIKSHFEEEYHIDYISNLEEYSICCNSDTYENALDYIKKHHKFSTKEKTKRIIYAFEDTGDDTNDITDKIIKYYGPNKDFYKETEFNIQAEFLSEYPIIVITNDLLIYRFKDSDILDIETDYCSFSIKNLKVPI